jgi:hypothetical protein
MSPTEDLHPAELDNPGDNAPEDDDLPPVRRLGGQRMTSERQHQLFDLVRSMLDEATPDE